MRSLLISGVLAIVFMTPAAAHPSILHGISFAAGVAHPLAGLITLLQWWQLASGRLSKATAPSGCGP